MIGLTRLLECLEGWPRWAVVLLCLGLTGIIGLADYYTGPALSSAIFYVAPIGIAAWSAGRTVGSIFAVLGSLAWLISDLGTATWYSHSLFPVWNALARFGLFLIIVYLLDSVRASLRAHQTLAYSDPLTGLANTRAFLQHADEEINRSRRYRHPFSVAYVDVDDFKAVNDTLGHMAGDELLRTVAQTMRKALRNTDAVARLGGDEFAVLFPETAADEARETLQKLLRRLAVQMGRGKWPVTFSVGLMTFDTPPADTARMLALSDALMYEVKKSGKNGFRQSRFGAEDPQPPSSAIRSEEGLDRVGPR